MSAGDRNVSPRLVSALPDGVAEGVAAGSPALTVPMWPCLCGARNRLRDTACRHCGTHKP